MCSVLSNPYFSKEVFILAVASLLQELEDIVCCNVLQVPPGTLSTHSWFDILQDYDRFCFPEANLLRRPYVEDRCESPS
jgi:hypothetical protein